MIGRRVVYTSISYININHTVSPATTSVKTPPISAFIHLADGISNVIAPK